LPDAEKDYEKKEKVVKYYNTMFNHKSRSKKLNIFKNGE